MPTTKPLYHWDVELQTLVPVPQNNKRERQPAITETTFNLIRELYKRSGGDVEYVHLATSWAVKTIKDVVEFGAYSDFRKNRDKYAREEQTRKLERQRQEALSRVETELAAIPEAELAELVAPTTEDATPLATDALDRIINALEGIDASLQGIRDDTRKSLELTQRLYDLWKPSN